MLTRWLSIPPETCRCQTGLRKPRCFPFQIGKDRAIGAMLAIAAVGEMCKRCDLILHFTDFPTQTVDLRQCKLLYIGPSARPVAPKGQQFGNPINGKAQIQRAADKAQHLHFGGRMGPLARSNAPGLREQPGRIVVAYHRSRYPRISGGFTNVHECLLTLAWLENAADPTHCPERTCSKEP